MRTGFSIDSKQRSDKGNIKAVSRLIVTEILER